MADVLLFAVNSLLETSSTDRAGEGKVALYLFLERVNNLC